MELQGVWGRGAGTRGEKFGDDGGDGSADVGGDGVAGIVHGCWVGVAVGGSGWRLGQRTNS